MEHVLNYVSAREDEVLEEGLWRTRFARKVHEDAASTTENLSALRDSNRALRESQALLIKRQDTHNQEVSARLVQLERLLTAAAVGGVPPGRRTSAAVAGSGSRPGSIASLPPALEQSMSARFDTRPESGAASPVVDEGGGSAAGGSAGVSPHLSPHLTTSDVAPPETDLEPVMESEREDLEFSGRESARDSSACLSTMHDSQASQTWRRLQRVEQAARAIGAFPSLSQMGRTCSEIGPATVPTPTGSPSPSRPSRADGTAPAAPPPLPLRVSSIGESSINLTPSDGAAAAPALGNAAIERWSSRDAESRTARESSEVYSESGSVASVSGRRREPSAETAMLERIQAFSPRHDPNRRKQRANWLMHRPLEGRGLVRQRITGRATEEEESSSSSESSDDEAREFVLPPSCSCVNVDEHDFRV